MARIKGVWQRHEKRVSEAIIAGLARLRSKEKLRRLRNIISSSHDKRPIEDKVNRELYFCLREANEELLKKGKGVKGLLLYETRNQPDFQDEIPGESEYKRCDFLWGFFDDLAVFREEVGERFFYIECKRLGAKIHSGALNEKYVQNGMQRFITTEHKYGKNESSGAMIGYVENMEFDNILNEINTAITAALEAISPLLKPSEGWQEQATSRIDHEFERPFPISPFHLWHFWIDLRGCYPRNKI